MYDLYSDFDIEQHKKHYTNYLEVVILEDGTVEYAVPSHQIKMRMVACEKLGLTHQELDARCPQEYWCDYLNWLCIQSGCIAVWNEFCRYATLTTAQVVSLRRLKMAGLYHGTVPSICSPFVDNRK